MRADVDLARRVLGDALASQRVVDRYRSHIRIVPGTRCLTWWTGAISSRGHGRFWLTEGHAIIAHRFGYALAYGAEALATAAVLGHECDNPLCQNPDDLAITTVGGNRREWAARRHRLGTALRDSRGARGRSLAIRAVLREGGNLQDVINAGTRPVDAGQGLLWNGDDFPLP